MNIFDDLIADHMIGGISQLKTAEYKDTGSVQFSFRVFLPKYEILIASELFGPRFDEQVAKEAWLTRYREVKEKIGRKLGEPEHRAAHVNQVNDLCDSIISSLNQALLLVQPERETDLPKIQGHTERLHTDLRKLKALATA